MRKIFCLETEWKQDIHDLKYSSSVLPILEYFKENEGLEFSFRQVATEEDFEYYINHLYNSTYLAYDFVYLCFHGSSSHFELPNRKTIDILEFARKHKGIFEGKTVHFGCCSTLDIAPDEAKEFKKLTGARLITGYQKDVSFTESFLFEFWLIDAILNHEKYAATRLQRLAETEMEFHAKKLGFIAF